MKWIGEGRGVVRRRSEERRGWYYTRKKSKEYPTKGINGVNSSMCDVFR